MSEPIAVSATDLGKCYRIYPTAKARMLEFFSGGRLQRHQEKWAVKGINFSVPRGSALGVIGANGSGKSTLLKMLTGTTRPSTGTFKIEGSLGSLLELGAGFHPEFTGRDNLFMNAAILGVPRAEVKRRFQELADFAELGDYLDRPVRTYSSGMSMRLGFAVAMMGKPDVLILDEVLAVGDQYFQKKCMDRIREIRERGTTILFVSHSTYHVRQICNQAIWIHQGQAVMQGDPTEVTDEYVNFQYALSGGQSAIAEKHGGGGALQGLPHLGDITVAAVGGTATNKFAGDTFEHGSEVEMRIQWHDPAQTGRHHVGFIVYRNDDIMCFAARSDGHLDAFGGTGGVVTARFPLALLAGDYYVSGFLLDESCDNVLDQRLSWARFKVAYRGIEKGVYRAPVVWAGGPAPA